MECLIGTRCIIQTIIDKMETPTLENLEPKIILLSENIEESPIGNMLLLCVRKSQLFMGNNIEKRLFYKNYYIDILTNGGNIERQYKGSNNKIISDIFDAQILNNYIILGSGCKEIIWIYDGLTMKIIKTINDCFANYYSDHSQLYVRNETTGINVYDINFNFRYNLTTGHNCYAIQHSNDNYLMCNYPPGSFHYANASGLFLNDGRTISSFNYKNTHETISLDVRYSMGGFLQLNNDNYNCYVFVDQSNLYVMDPTFKTILCHEIWSISEKDVYKVVYVGGNYFDVYWNIAYTNREPLTHIEHWYLKIPDSIILQKIGLKTELVKRIRIDYWDKIYFLMRNIPDTQIVKRICSSGKIVEYFRDGSHIKYSYLVKGQKIIEIPNQYTVCVLENKIFFGFNSNILHVYDNKTLEFIKTFDNVVCSNTNKNYLCLYKSDKTIECYDQDLKLCTQFNLNSCECDHNNQLQTNTPSIVGMYQLQNIFICYIVYPEIKGIQIYNVSTKNKRTITTYAYDNQEITIEYPQNICQITDDENNNYWLVSDTQTIYVINQTFDRVIYYENLNIVIEQIKNINGNCFDVFYSLKDNENHKFLCLSRYIIKKITDGNCIDGFNEF